MQKTGLTINSFFLVLSGLKKSFTLDVMTRGTQQPSSCVLGHFRHGDEQSNNRTTNRVILEQASSWPMWEGSLLQYWTRIVEFFSVMTKSKQLVWSFERAHEKASTPGSDSFCITWMESLKPGHSNSGSNQYITLSLFFSSICYD